MTATTDTGAGTVGSLSSARMDRLRWTRFHAKLAMSLYDTIGRKPMIAGTYLTAGVLLVVSDWPFDADLLNSITLTICCA